MATVPRISAPSVAPAAAPNVQLQNTQTADLLTVGARQQQQFGQALTGLGTALEDARIQALEQGNALLVDDSVNQLNEVRQRLTYDPNDGYTALKGVDAMGGAQPLAEDFAACFDDAASKISTGLKNERQREMFKMRAGALRSQFYGSALAYESQQQQEYKLSVRDATTADATNSIALAPNDEASVQLHTYRLRSSIEGGREPDGDVFIPGSAQMQGKSAAWAKEKADEAVSAAYTTAIAGLMERGDLNGAAAFRQRYKASLLPKDMLKIDGTLERNYETARGAAAGHAAAQAVLPTIDPSVMDRVRAVRDKLESSSGDFNPDGSLVLGPLTRSGERAMGGAQVMPSTAKNPGYGIRPADLSGTPRQQAAELRRVGDQKLDVLVKMFDGDLAKTMAAYNWGEGSIKDADKKAHAAAGAGERVARDAWLAYAPKETRNYVANFVKMLNDPVASAPVRATAEQVAQAARDSLGPNASPWAVKAATEAATQRLELQTKAMAQRKDEIVAAAYQALERNGGRWSEVPASLRAGVEQRAPDKLDDLRNFGARISKGDDVTDDRLYLRLTTNPEEMVKKPDDEFYQLRGGLSKADFDHFTKVRAGMLAGKSSTSPGDLNTSAISRVANQRLSSIGIDPTPKDGSADSQRVGAIRRFIDSSLLDAQRAAGKKFDDAQVQAHIDGLFAKNVTFRKTFLGFNTFMGYTPGTVGQRMLSMKVGDIPERDAEAIKQKFKDRGIDSPSESDILGAYFVGDRAEKKAATRRGANGSF